MLKHIYGKQLNCFTWHSATPCVKISSTKTTDNLKLRTAHGKYKCGCLDYFE